MQEAIAHLEDQFWEFSREGQLETPGGEPPVSEEEASAMAWRSLQAATALRHLLRPSRRQRHQVRKQSQDFAPFVFLSLKLQSLYCSYSRFETVSRGR